MPIQSQKKFFILRAEVTLKKEELYQKVFGLEPESKEDLQRLSKNIYKLNKKNKEQIIYHKGSYKLAS